jgi:hypothetical protein
MGRFIQEGLTAGDDFLTTEELTTAYTRFLTDNGYEDHFDVDQRALINRLKEQPGVRQVTRVKGGTRHRGIVGRTLKIDTHDTGVP